MSRRRRRRAPLGQRIAAVAVMVLAAALVIFLLSRLVLGVVRLIGGGSGGRDPQFAEQAEGVTRPPELAGEDGSLALGDDPSAGWDLGEQTPVDKTAEELSREAAAGQ